MPPKGTKKNANQHDKRHENGLAPPSKRVTKQRSNGQLNAQPNGKPAHAVSPPALPSKGLNQGFKFPRPTDSNTTSETVSLAAKDHAAHVEGRERDRTSSNASAESVGPCGEMAGRIHEHTSVTPTSELHPAADNNCRSHAVPAKGAASAFSTILAGYPLRDAISILILLLSLPPTLVLVIQTLFASLTFVPPSAGISLSTLPNIKELFNSSSFGYPAMATILFVDLVFWSLWLLFWRPVQNVLLDLSHAVIAVSLSGAAATSRPTYSIATCSILVCVVHVLRYKAIHLTALDYLRSVLQKLDIGLPLDAPSFANSFNSVTPLERGMAITAIRTILGIHIVSQGVTTAIRRTLANAKANEKDPNIPVITKTDTEATAGVEPSARSSSGHGHGHPEGLQPSPNASSSTDGRTPGQPPANKQRESSSKKKRKQANQVRSQQPLWAAIASTKVTFVKEMEQRDAADDGREATAMSNDTPSISASATSTPSDRFWTCDIRDTEIVFYVVLSPREASEEIKSLEDLPQIAPGIDSSKPFYVRVNGAAWSSTRILDAEHDNTYVGEIFGLAPRSSYKIEIVEIAKEEVLCTTGLITQPERTYEQTVVPLPTQHQSLRPASPITTLKQSIVSAQARLEDARSRGRRNKKDQRSALADIKKEINALRSKLDSSGGVDDRQQQRRLQINQHKTQAEEATADLKKQIEALGEIPADELAESQIKRRAYQSALDAKKAADRDFEEAKAEQDREVDALKSDIKSFESKKEKMAARSAQRAQELEKLRRRQQADMTAKQKRDQERDLEHQRREEYSKMTKTQIIKMEDEMRSFMTKAQEAYNASIALQNYPVQLAIGHPGYSSPPTPEGIIPGSNGQISPHANGFSSFAPATFGSPFQAHASPAGTHPRPVGAPRVRSSSMLSAYSGFTDTDDDFNYMHGDHRHQNSWPAHTYPTIGALEDRKPSDGDTASGSGSGSGSGGGSSVNEDMNGSNSPRPEAKVFVPGAATAKSSPGPIGPPIKKAPQSPLSTNARAVGNGI